MPSSVVFESTDRWPSDKTDEHHIPLLSSDPAPFQLLRYRRGSYSTVHMNRQPARRGHGHGDDPDPTTGFFQQRSIGLQ